MNWSDIGNTIKHVAGDALPLIGGLLGGPAGGAVGSMVASALGVSDKPDAVDQALKADPQALEKLKEAELQHKTELQKLAVQAESNRLAADTARLAQVNQTMRAESESSDPYVRHWRPTWGYVTAAAWALQSLALCALVGGGIWATLSAQDATPLFDGAAKLLSALTVQWSIALAVLGINVTKRSQDKQVAAGQTPGTGIVGAIAQRLSGAPGAQQKAKG